MMHPFRDDDTYATFRRLIEKTVAEIEALENDYVLKASPTELEQYYISKVLITPLTLDAENHYIESQTGTEIDVSHDFRRGTFGEEHILARTIQCAVTRRHSSAGANPARQLSLQPVAVGADDGGNDIG